MKKLIMFAAVAAMCIAANAVTVVTNAVDVYNVKMSLKVPTVKYDKKVGVFKSYEARKLTGDLVYYWISEDDGTNINQYVDVSFAAADSKNKGQTLKFSVVGDRSDFSLMGKKLSEGTMTLNMIGEGVSVTNSGYMSMACVGKGSTKDYKTAVEICGACGITSTTAGKCRKVTSVSGNVVGAYSCGCGDESPAFAKTECGYAEDLPTAVNGFYGTWTAKYNKKLSDAMME